MFLLYIGQDLKDLLFKHKLSVSLRCAQRPVLFDLVWFNFQTIMDLLFYNIESKCQSRIKLVQMNIRLAVKPDHTESCCFQLPRLFFFSSIFSKFFCYKQHPYWYPFLIFFLFKLIFGFGEKYNKYLYNLDGLDENEVHTYKYFIDIWVVPSRTEDALWG